MSINKKLIELSTKKARLINQYKYKNQIVF